MYKATYLSEWSVFLPTGCSELDPIMSTSALESQTKTNISLYADDTKVFCIPDEQHGDFLIHIEIIERWTKMWQLRLDENVTIETQQKQMHVVIPMCKNPRH